MATVCQKCGVTGYSELLIHCSNCKIAAEHRYCLDKIPDSDVLQVHWSCEQCEARIYKVASRSKVKHRSSRLWRESKHNDICRNKYGHRGTPCAARSPLSLRSQNENFSGLRDTERSGCHKSIELPSGSNGAELPSSSNGASASKIGQACAGLLKKEIRDDKSRSRTHRWPLILAKDEVGDENCRHYSSGKDIEGQNPERSHRQFFLIKDQDEALPSSKNAQDTAIKSKVQITAADEALNKLQHGSVDASKSQAMMWAETYEAERNISGHQMFIDRQIYELVRPMIICVWSGCFEICNEAYGPIKAHLSNKACEKVCITAAKLPPVLQMAKLSKLEAWPRSFKNSAPTGYNIALYFFPDSSRAKSMLDRLLCDVISKDLVLKVVFNEAELLVFPSITLPEVYHRFQGSYYLWGVFKGRQVPVHCAPAAPRLNDLPPGEKKDGLQTCSRKDQFSL